VREQESVSDFVNKQKKEDCIGNASVRLLLPPLHLIEEKKESGPDHRAV
jgi:hypothetical protein